MGESNMTFMVRDVLVPASKRRSIGNQAGLPPTGGVHGGAGSGSGSMGKDRRNQTVIQHCLYRIRPSRSSLLSVVSSHERLRPCGFPREGSPRPSAVLSYDQEGGCGFPLAF